MLHYIATAGEIDMHISRIKFGKGCAPAMSCLIRMGHPIEEVRRQGHRRWRWIGE